ncbi:MAG TPA: hypothetical protein VGM88_27915 [Kofleriaceae bacterium]|jgi:hypothetical protein
MATPNYKGTGQPSSTGGSWLGTLVGGTPAYKSVDKGASNAAAGYTGAGPAYKPAPASVPSPDVTQSAAPAVDPSADESMCGRDAIAIVIPREVIEQQ